MTTGASRFLFFPAIDSRLRFSCTSNIRKRHIAEMPFRSALFLNIAIEAACWGVGHPEHGTGVLLLDIPRRIQPRASQNLYKRAPPDGLRLPIFPQPLGGALKNRSAAPASPPCLGRRPRSAPLPFKSSYPHGTGVLLLDIPKFLGTAH